MVFCTECGEFKDGSHPKLCKPCAAIYRRSVRRLNCKDCGTRIEQEWSLTYCKACRIRHKPTVTMAQQRQTLYGVTSAHFERMWNEQDGECRLCGCQMIKEGGNRKPSAVCLDHCHSSKKVRGLLCMNCNKGLGFFKDDADLLFAAALYVLEFSEIKEEV